MKIKMNNGNNIHLNLIHQRAVYRGLMAGLPNPQMNKSIVEHAVKEANQILFQSDSNIKFTLVPPVITEYETPLKKQDAQNHKYPCLPGYMATILLDDWERHAVVVLFTNEIANRQEIQELVKHLNWEEISEEYSW